MDKNYETAQELGEALNFVSEYCAGEKECNDCMFADHGTCCFSSEPYKWDLYTVMLNMGIRLGEERKHE